MAKPPDGTVTYLRDDGGWCVTRPDGRHLERSGLHLPPGAWEAIAEAAAPMADAGAVGALTAALELERRRVDLLVGAAIERVR